MAKLLEKQRYKCALAAMQTVQAIDGACPILHAGPGCGNKLTDARAGSSGHFASVIFPSTNVNEKDVVFGGEKKLRTTIENSLKVLDAELFMVLTGCSQEIVGDDVPEIVSEFEDADKPVIYVSTAGFKGNNYKGHEWVIDALINDYLEPAKEKEKGLINIWADVPYQDIFWYGNYRALEELLRSIGLKPNTIFGHRRGVENVKKIPKAEFNLVVSPWVGLENAKRMEQKFGIPYLHYPTLPIGAFETSKFLYAVAEFTGADKALVDAYVKEKEDEYYYFIERFADIFLETRVMSRRFSVVSDAQYALAVTKFLVNDLGLFPNKQFVTDDTPEEYRELITKEFESLNYGVKAEVLFETDGYKIDEAIKGDFYYGYPLIVGSFWEKELAENLEANFLSISNPSSERIIMDRSYVGYEGGLRLVEDLYAVVLKRFN